MVVASTSDNPLFIPTYPHFRDMLRTAKTEGISRAILFPPLSGEYVCRDGALYRNGVPQSFDQLKQLIGKGSIPDPILVYGLFTFFYHKGDIRNRATMECDWKELWHFLGRKEGGNAYRLQDVLASYESVVGWVFKKGVFPLLKVENLPGNRVRLTSEYFHHAMNALLATCTPEDVSVPRRYRATSMHRSVLLHRNKFAALISLEFARIMESSGQNKSQISIRTLLKSVPTLGAALADPSKSVSFRNRKLRDALTAAVEILWDHSDLPRRYPNMWVQLPEHVSVNKLGEGIELWRDKNQSDEQTQGAGNGQPAGKGGETTCNETRE